MFVGAFLLTAAVITWATSLLMSPHGESTSSSVEHVRTVVVVYVRNTAIGTLVRSALSAWLLFPSRRPRKPIRDWFLIGIIAVLTLGSLYQLFWLRWSVAS